MAEKTNTLYRCGICMEDHEREDMTHLKLYVKGSEGLLVCLSCRIALTNVARAMREAAGRAWHKEWMKKRR